MLIYELINKSASKRVTNHRGKSSMRKRLNWWGEGGGREAGKQHCGKRRTARWGPSSHSSPAEGSEQMQRLWRTSGARPPCSGLNTAHALWKVQGNAYRSVGCCYHLTLLLLEITSDLCLNQAFRASHRFGEREYETNVRKFKQTYYFPFKLKYIS